MAVVSKDYESSVCEVRTMQNELISAGTITAVNEEYIEVRAKGGAMPMVHYNDQIKLHVFNYRLGLLVVSGKAYISNTQMLRLVDCIVLRDRERRNFYRVATSMPAYAAVTHRPTAGEVGLPPAVDEISVRVLNLSLGGALLETDQELVTGERLLLNLTLNKRQCSFQCQVGRGGPVEGTKKFHFGCRFTDARNRESSALCSYIFQMQRRLGGSMPNEE